MTTTGMIAPVVRE